MNTHSHNIPQWDRGGSTHASPNQAVGENRDEMSKVMLLLSRDHKIIVTRSRWLRENPHARYISVSQRARVISEAQVDLPATLYPRYRMIDAICLEPRTTLAKTKPILGSLCNVTSPCEI
ncbi:Protein AIM7 [Fusarium oxysporum f. sp. albedinis]|nr:Protein AIM7 [Fusarium oxysporum f. sp. albedinis]